MKQTWSGSITASMAFALATSNTPIPTSTRLTRPPVPTPMTCESPPNMWPTGAENATSCSLLKRTCSKRIRPGP